MTKDRAHRSGVALVDRAGAEVSQICPTLGPGGAEIAESVDRIPRSAELVLQSAAHRRVGLEGHRVSSIEHVALGPRLTESDEQRGFLDGARSPLQAPGNLGDTDGREIVGQRRQTGHHGGRQLIAVQIGIQAQLRRVGHLLEQPAGLDHEHPRLHRGVGDARPELQPDIADLQLLSQAGVDRVHQAHRLQNFPPLLVQLRAGLCVPAVDQQAERAGARERLHDLAQRHDVLETDPFPGREVEPAAQLGQPLVHQEGDGDGEEQGDEEELLGIAQPVHDDHGWLKHRLQSYHSRPSHRVTPRPARAPADRRRPGGGATGKGRQRG